MSRINFVIIVIYVSSLPRIASQGEVVVVGTS